ncbi:MAG: magnesium-protoporphyrin IX monomethyl ester (oxidative) cyclase [uncultured bacterium]|nr:MAG: magnesium-protoporphyrin IX monomethyl ester (oxidative) cyclase [uncultured bacterium]
MTKTSPKIALVMPEFHVGLVQNSIPLNLAYIGAVLREDGFDVSCFNLQQEDIKKIDFSKFDVIGITITSSMFPDALNTIKTIKENSKAIIVAGGAHATAEPEKIITKKEIDVAIYGEGEYTMRDICRAVAEGRSFDKIKGLAFKNSLGKIVKNPPRPILKDLDTLPFPAKDLFDVTNYPDKKTAYGDIIATRGCPFKCTNCKPGLDLIAPYRIRKVEKVVDELEENIKRYGVKHFTFSDSELAGPPKWTINLCKEIINRKLKITFSCNGRTDQVNKEVLTYLKRAGCVFIGYGIESGSEHILNDILKKGINLDQTRKVIDMTVKSGIGTGSWFMIGIPGEKKEDIVKSVSYAKTLNASTIELSIATPWPATGFYETCKKNGWLVTEDYTKYNDKYTSVISTPWLSAKDVVKGLWFFIDEMKKDGWKVDKKTCRMYHPHFFLRTVRTSFAAVMKRGIQMGDIKKGAKWALAKF